MQGLADEGISGIILHVGTPLSVQVGSARQRRPSRFCYGWFLPSALSPGLWFGAGLSLRLESEVTVQEHCRLGSAAILDNSPLHLGVSLCPEPSSSVNW